MGALRRRRGRGMGIGESLADCGAQLEPLGLLCGSFCFADFLLSFSLTLKKIFRVGQGKL